MKSIYIHTGNNSIEDDRVFEVNGKWDIWCIKLLDAYCMYWWPGGRLSIDCSSARCTMAASWETAYMLHTPMAPFRPFSHCKPVLYRWVRATRQPAFPNAAKHPNPSCFLWPHPRSKIILVLFISPAYRNLDNLIGHTIKLRFNSTKSSNSPKQWLFWEPQIIIISTCKVLVSRTPWRILTIIHGSIYIKDNDGNFSHCPSP